MLVCFGELVQCPCWSQQNHKIFSTDPSQEDEFSVTYHFTNPYVQEGNFYINLIMPTFTDLARVHITGEIYNDKTSAWSPKFNKEYRGNWFLTAETPAWNILDNTLTSGSRPQYLILGRGQAAQPKISGSWQGGDFGYEKFRKTNQ